MIIFRFNIQARICLLSFFIILASGVRSETFAQVTHPAGSGTSFPTLADIADFYNTQTLTSNVRFVLKSDLQVNSQVVFNRRSGAYTVTITTDGQKRTISGSVLGSLIKLNGSDNLVFDGIDAATSANPLANKLVIANTQTGSASQCIEIAEFSGKSTNVVIRNTELYSSAETYPGNYLINAIAARLTVEGCYLHNAYEAVGVTYTDNVTLSKNIVRTVRRSGFSINNPYAMVCTVEGNHITQVTGLPSVSDQMLYGIHLVSADPFAVNSVLTVNNNIIDGISNTAPGISGAYGMVLSVIGTLTADGNVCKNISNNTPTDNYSAAGIFCELAGNGTAMLSNNIVSNITDQNLPMGIEIGSDSGTASGKITSCSVSGVFAVTKTYNNARGISMKVAGNVTGCTINNVSAPEGRAIGLLGFNPFSGMQLHANNRIWDVKGWMAAGVFLENTAGPYKIYHNTISFGEKARDSDEAFCIDSYSTIADIRNNLLTNLVSTGTALNSAIVLSDNFAGTLSGNRYNIFAAIGRKRSGASYTNINQWNADMNDFSTCVNKPALDTELHLAGFSKTDPLLHTALLADVPADCDNDPRTACSNAAGADNLSSTPVFTMNGFKVTPPVCLGAELTVAFNTTGGVPPFRYRIDGGSYSAPAGIDSVNVWGTVAFHFAKSMTVGNHTIELTDVNNCTFQSATVTVPSYNAAMPTGTTVFVKQTATGTGNGSSWDNAFDGRYLAQYLRSGPASNTRIYVAAGTYLPYLDGCDNAAIAREYAFELNTAVELRGGFAASATGTDLSSFNPASNVTRLSGEIQGNSNHTDNSCHVVWGRNAGAVIDGFHVSGGYADGTGSAGSNPDNGGGVYLSNAVVMRNMTITDNQTKNNGGGIFASTGVVSFSLTGSTLKDNIAADKGGGIYSDAAVTLGETTISGNQSGTNGGGIYAAVGLILQGNIIFENNTAQKQGGAIWKSGVGSFLTSGTTSVEIINNQAVTGQGGGMYTVASLSLRNAKITRNTSGNLGGGIYAESSVSLTLEDFEVTDNTAKNHGGGIIVSTGSTFRNGTISGNESLSGSGGGIYASNNAPLTLTGIFTFENNTAYNNGGALWTGTGTFSTSGITKAVIAGNTATTGQGGGINSGAPFVANSWEVRNNRAGTTGGGININSTGSLVMSGSVLTGNTAGGNGGGIYAGAALTLKNVTASGNKAGYDPATKTYPVSSDGGAVYANNTLTLQEAIVCENDTAANRGGGIYKSTNGIFDVSGITSLKINNNAARNSTGGGISTFVTLDLPAAASVEITGNTAGGNGGGIHAAASLTLSNAVVSNNRAGYDFTTKSYTGQYDGGGINAGAALTLKGSVVCDNNTTARHGGGIYKSATGTFDVTGITSFKVNNCTTIQGAGFGGGIFTLTDLIFPAGASVEIKNNKAGGYGGGIYTTAALGNLVIDGNDGAAGGGGIYAAAILAISNVTVTGNTSGSSGGGILSAPSAALTLSNVNISGNISAGNGGGVYSTNTLTLNKATISNNKAGYIISTGTWQQGYGGGIYANNALTLQGDIVLAADTAGNSGGAIYKAVTGAFTADNSLSLKIRNNAARSNSGGGIYTLANISFPDNIPAEITGNTAGTFGGGISTGVTITVSNLTISDNTSPAGGGIYSAPSTALTVNKCIISDNTAKNTGGGIHAGTLTMNSVTVSGNKAGYDAETGKWVTTSNGGGIYLSGTLIMSGDMVFTGNTTAGSGGGIYKSTNATFTATGLTSLIIKDNIASTGPGGGGYFAGSYSGTTPVGTVDLSAAPALISGNSAGGNGGGIMAASMLILKDAIISDNKAGYDALTGIWLTKGNGGAISTADITAQGTLTATNNEAAGSGGAIYKTGGNHSVLLTGITLLKMDGNKARNGSGGGFWASSALTLPAGAFAEFTGNTATVSGGGIYILAPLTLNNALFTGNEANNGGGIYATTMNLVNNTFSGNSATNNGGAVYSSASADIIFSTFNGNSAASGAGNAVWLNNASNKTLNGNIIYGNGTGSEININPATANYNIVRNGTLPGTNRNIAAGKADSIFANVSSGDLAILANNGGPVQTLDIFGGGYAHNFIPKSVTWATGLDQRNMSRPYGCRFDAGAVETRAADVTMTIPVDGPTEACTGDRVPFNAGTFTTYQWSVISGDGAPESPTANPAFFTWSTSGTKTVKVQVVDSDGCTGEGQTSILIRIHPETGPMYLVPNKY